MLRRSAILISSAIASGAIVVGAISLFGGTGDPDSTQQISDGSDQSAQLPDNFEQEMANLGITYSPMTGPSASVSSDAASQTHESVLREFGAILDKQREYSVESVKFTDENFGSVDDLNSSDPSVKPYYVDRDAFMIVFPHQAMAPEGPPNIDQPTSVDSTFVAFVDMESEEVLRAVSFAS